MNRSSSCGSLRPLFVDNSTQTVTPTPEPTRGSFSTTPPTTHQRDEEDSVSYTDSDTDSVSHGSATTGGTRAAEHIPESVVVTIL